MAIGEDRVQVTKVESTALGGKDSDADIYGAPIPIKPQEDAIESAGGYVQDAGNRDETVGWRRVSGELELFDNAVPAGATITEMLEPDDDQVKKVVPTGVTFTVKEDHQHIVFQQLVIDGEYIVDGESVVFGGEDVQGFDAYDGTGATPLSGWTDVPLTIEGKKTGCFEHEANSPEVKIKRKGTYLVFFRSGVGVASGGDRSSSYMRVLKNGSPLGGNRGDMYNRTADEGKDSTTVPRLLDFDAGDILKVQVNQDSGTNSLELQSEASGIVLLKVG